MPDIPLADVEITPLKRGGPGGQKRNVTESAVRVRHLPTGIIVVEGSSRSQHRNKEAALEELARRLERMRRPRKRRVATRPSKGQKARRVENKRRQSEKKASRKSPRRWD